MSQGKTGKLKVKCLHCEKQFLSEGIEYRICYAGKKEWERSGEQPEEASSFGMILKSPRKFNGKYSHE